jgi:hypothetical protein
MTQNLLTAFCLWKVAKSSNRQSLIVTKGLKNAQVFGFCDSSFYDFGTDSPVWPAHYNNPEMKSQHKL